ncbi:transposase [Demetria terragena]|uniref:transposase n=1 Tax=Demetria terragena TaxID=63959 RepID=UPI00039AAB48
MALERVAGKDVHHARSYPQEFRDDAVRVARNREPGQKVSQIATDFGISESCLTNWTHQADVEDGARPGMTREGSSELRDFAAPEPAAGAGDRGLRRVAAYS